MAKIVHNVKQGTSEWIELRKTPGIWTASEMAAYLGVSLHQSRRELIHSKATGIVKDVDPFTQERFDNGHLWESLARPIAEKIVGGDLYPVVMSDDGFMASLDGLTMNRRICFEHKTLNKDLELIFKRDGISVTEWNNESKFINSIAISSRSANCFIPKAYHPQMEVGLMVTGAEKCLFAASRWNDNEELEDFSFAWYFSDPDLRKHIIFMKQQAEIDLANYKPIEVKEAPKANAVEELPSLIVHATGEVVSSNLKAYSEALNNRLKFAKSIVLTTDQDFANADKLSKNLREAVDKMKLVKQQIMDQSVSVGEQIRQIDALAENVRLTALQLEKDCKNNKENKKTAIIIKAKEEFSNQIKSLELQLGGFRINVAMPDFAVAMKGKSLISSWIEAVDSLLANSKAEAIAKARELQEKVDWFNGPPKSFDFLFADIDRIIEKPIDDFMLAVNVRIEKYKDDEFKKLNSVPFVPMDGKSTYCEQNVVTELNYTINNDSAKSAIESKTNEQFYLIGEEELLHLLTCKDLVANGQSSEIYIRQLLKNYKISG